MSENTYRPRRVELMSAGLVRAYHQVGTTKSGRSAVQWVVASASGTPTEEPNG